MTTSRAIIFLIVLAALYAPAVAAEKPALIKPVPSIIPVKIGKLSPAFDWITKERIRAMFGYVYQKNDKALFKNIVDNGFNTIVVHFMGTALSEDGCPKAVADWVRIAKEYKLKVIINVAYGADDRYSNTRFGAYNTGNAEIWQRGPCPLSRDYWNKVVGDRAVIAAEAKLTGLVVDMEMYGADATCYPGPCYCDSCWGKFVDEFIGGEFAKKTEPTKRAAWVSNNGLWEEYGQWQEVEVTSILQAIRKRVHAVNPDFILGNLLDPESLPGITRGFGTASMPHLIFSELEYHGNVTGVPARLTQLKDQGYPAMYVPGLWVQPVTPPQITGLISEAAPPSAGYWIWPAIAFTPNPTGDFAHAKGYTDDDYWNAFRSANDVLTKIIKSRAKTVMAEPKVPTAMVPRVSKAPATEDDWSRAALIGPFVGLFNGEPAEVNTSARILWDGKNLFVRVMCDEPTPEKMTPPSGERDSGTQYNQESIEVFWTRPHADRMAHLVINNAGTVSDALLIGPRPEAYGWNCNIKTETLKTDKGWELRLSIPLEEDGGGSLSPGSKLLFEIARNRGAGGGPTCWAAVKGMYKGAPHLWGVLTLK